MDSLPVLMDDELLWDAVFARYPILSSKDEAFFREVPELRLECKKILKIDFLTEFTSLAKLDLHSNLIQKIQGLNCLVNLKWLNLSFNRIKKIEGLESLRKLEVLDLSNNRISLIENMDALENLTHFQVANNFISQLDNVLYLRRFKKLFKVYLTGNPVSEENEYIMFIAAFLPNLMGLDEIFIDKKTKNEASAKYKSVIKKIKQEELQKQQADAAQIHKQAELKLHKDAFVESLNGPYLFKSMFEDDPVAATLSCLPGMTSLLQTFEDQMVELCMSLFDTGLAEHKRRETELNSFFSGQKDAETYYKQEASQILEKFDQRHIERTAKLNQLTDPDLIKVEINHCNDEIDQLIKSLMTLSFRRIGNLEDNINILDTCISDMVDDFCKTTHGIFDQCRDLEDNHHHKVEEIAVATLQKVAQGNLEEDMPDDLIMLFKDENAVMNALAASHDNHLLKINDWKNQLITDVISWKVALLKENREKEAIWHRIHLSDVLRYGDYLKECLRTFSSIQ